MIMTNNQYDFLKRLVQVILPGLGTLYFALSGIWGFPYGEAVVGTLSAVAVFLGASLGISTNRYQGDGTIHIDPNERGGSNYNLVLEQDIEDVVKKGQVTFKVDASQN